MTPERVVFWWLYWSHDREAFRILRRGLGSDWEWFTLNGAPWSFVWALLAGAMCLVAAA